MRAQKDDEIERMYETFGMSDTRYNIDPLAFLCVLIFFSVFSVFPALTESEA